MKLAKHIHIALSALLIIACGKGTSQLPADQNQVTIEQLSSGNAALVEVNDLEKKLLHVKFTKDLQVLNGDVTTTLTIVPSIETKSDLLEAKDSITEYVAKLDQFLNDYPASQYSLLSRQELESKLDLAKKMLTKINEVFAAL
jgi:hypothetical protein